MLLTCAAPMDVSLALATMTGAESALDVSDGASLATAVITPDDNPAARYQNGITQTSRSAAPTRCAGSTPRSVFTQIINTQQKE